jgi:hypothetical protein
MTRITLRGVQHRKNGIGGGTISSASAISSSSSNSNSTRRRRHWMNPRNMSISLALILMLTLISLGLVRMLLIWRADSSMSSYYYNSGWWQKSIADVVDDEEGIDPEQWSQLKIAVYMTTHGSTSHVRFLEKCWPSAIQKLKILSDAHLILYTAVSPSPETMESLRGFQSIVVHQYEQLPIPANATRTEREAQKQNGAKRAVTDPYDPISNHLDSNETTTTSWFDGYDWVIRLNPDVLIRREKWLRQTMLMPDVDAILIDYSTPQQPLRRLNTDFYAFRPAAMDRAALIREFDRQSTAEMHLGAALQSILQSHRFRWVPDTTRYKAAARVLGRQSPVIHAHAVVNSCPDYWNATDGVWW